MAIEESAEITAVGGLISTSGAIISTLSGSGKAGVVDSVTRLSTMYVPNGPVKDFAAQAISTGLNAIVPEIEACRK
ncbi:MAG: hypothetical protein P8Y48_18745 [Novosphingobium sp.]